MKKFAKRTILFFIIILLISISSFVSFAETTYILDGYTYTVIDNLSISLKNWDTSIDPALSIPDELANRYFTEVSNWAFENRTDIKSVKFDEAKHLKKIGYESFIGCSGISTDLVIPESIELLSERSFSECSSIPSITINGSVRVIPVECFYGCVSVTSVVLPESLQSIQSWAFGNCSSLEYVEIPKSVKSIAVSAFLNDPNLVLGVYKDTYALQYAEENQIDHIILDGDKIGDVNGDGVVDILDASEIQKYAAESTDFTPEQFELGDINKDGYCNVIDALLVQKSVIGAYEIPQNIIRY